MALSLCSLRNTFASNLFQYGSTLLILFGFLVSCAMACRPMQVASFSKDLSVSVVTATAVLWGVWGLTSSPSHAKSKSSAKKREANAALEADYLTRANNKDKKSTPAMLWRAEYGQSVYVPLYPGRLSVKKRGDELKKYTTKEVAEKNTPEELWIIIDELVYDVTNLVAKHPGGNLVLLDMGGKDCSDVFANYHAASIFEKYLPTYLIGECSDVPVYPHATDFRSIRQELLRRGLFETDPNFYTQKYIWYASLFVTALYFSLVRTSTLSHFIGAVVMGFFWQQLAGWGHDLGHSSVTNRSSTDNWIASTIGCAFMGLSTGWWRRSHNVHHVVCNSIEHDCDIQHMPIMAVSPKIIEKRFWSTYNLKWVEMDMAAKFIIRYQHCIYFPLMCVARFFLYKESWFFLLGTSEKESIQMHNRGAEIVSMLVFASWVLSVCLSMPTWNEFFMWGLTSHAVTCLMHHQITTSHYSMETYHGCAYNDESDEFFKMQIKTTLNVDCYECMDWFHIGLQHQLEHHLFPQLPRYNQRIARLMVKDVCFKHNIQYNEKTFFQGVYATYNALRTTAMAARTGIYDSQSSSMLMDALRAQG